MKKILLGTSAIVLAGAIASPAAAAEWEVRVGGYMEQLIGYAEQDEEGSADFSGVDTKSDAEVHFSPRITLDNGLQFGARIELEGSTNSDQIDENYAYIEGSFGRLVIGEDDNAAYIMGYSAPDVTFVNINSGSDTLFLPFSAGFGLVTTTFISLEADSAGIRYFTPRLAGFQLGVSYARDANKSTDDAQKDEDADGALVNIFGVGANYVNSFGEFNIAASGGYTRGDRNSVEASPGIFIGPLSGENAEIHEFDCDSNYGSAGFDEDDLDSFDVIAVDCTAHANSMDPEAWSAALNLGYGGFTIGGSYAEFDETGGSDGHVYDAGVSYETGPWGFSFTYVHGKHDDTNDKIDKFLLGMNYNLAKGVNVGAFGIYEDLNGGGEREDNDGFVIGTGLKLSF